jgi:hypothetical protein
MGRLRFGPRYQPAAALRRRITRFEQFAHTIPEHRYHSHFSAPLNNVFAGAAAAAGTSPGS